MKRDDQTTLDVARRIVALCDTLSGLVDEDLATFAGDVRSQWAVGMGLIRIGETVNRLPSEAREEFDGQPWRQIVGLRNMAAHQYDELTPARVWGTAHQDVPALRSYVMDSVMPVVEQRLRRSDLA